MISEQIEFHIKYFIFFQYIIQLLPNPHYYFHCTFMSCKKKSFWKHLKKPSRLGQIHFWTTYCYFYSLDFSRSHCLKLLSSVKHSKSLHSEAHWSNLIFSELLYQTLPYSYDVDSSSGKQTSFLPQRKMELPLKLM